ncbi:MAG TPA: molecular chaperone HtpG [Gemmataceae bacterium]|nr:molecular chaperone HtpG [Gemmataceae bacterium]
MTQTAPHSEKREFKTELKQLLHIITHSLYSNKEIFLRELISNASDAINKLKFDSLQHEEKLEGDKDWKIKISIDKDKNTLTISDNGVGMSRDLAIEQLGTIAKSGTRAFLESLKSKGASDRPELIGQFGVGFYSAFMVADKVAVVSRLAGDPPDQGVCWESDGQGDFTVETVTKERRGTDVTLHLKTDEKEFLDPYNVRQIVKKFSDFIEHPVVMDVEKEEKKGEKTVVEETLNSRKALWLRGKSEVTPEEYTEFYKQIAGDYAEPARVVHYTAEGANEFRVLAFLPAHRPMELQWGDFKAGLRLYIQRVLVMERCEELLPPYLRFVRGVVDSSDLPLNISRELLQHNPLLGQMKKNITRTVLNNLEDMKEHDYDKYLGFWKELGEILKEGVGRDHANRDKLADLLLFESLKTPAGQFTTLAKYVEAMPAEQKEIVYIIGDSREQVEHSPLLESFRARGWDVLLLTDPIDEFVIPSLPEYKGKKLQAADRGEVEEEKKEKKKTKDDEKYKKLFDYLKSKLPEVSEVRLSGRLKESASCLVAGEGEMSAHLERLMQRMGRVEETAAGRRILELNGEHPAVVALRELYEKNADDPRIESHGRLLYEQAVIAEGSKIKDPAAFARRINELLVRDARA